MSNIFSFISDSLKSNSSASTNSFASLFSSALNGNTANSTPALLPNTNTPVQINKKSIDLKSIGNFSTGKNETIKAATPAESALIKKNPVNMNDVTDAYTQRTKDITPKLLEDRQIQKEKDNANMPGLVKFFTSIPTETFKGLTRLPYSIEQVIKSASDNLGGENNVVSNFLQNNMDNFKQNYQTNFAENPTSIPDAISGGYKQYGILGAVGLGSLEVLAEVPLFPESKGISNIARTTDVNIIKKELSAVYKNIDDSILNNMAEDLSKINTKKGVTDYLKSVTIDAKKASETIKKSEPIIKDIPTQDIPLIEEAKKYQSAEEFANAQIRGDKPFNVKQESAVHIEEGKTSFTRNDGNGNKETIGTLSDLSPATRKEFIDAKNALDKAKGTGMENTKPAGERYFKAKSNVDAELFKNENAIKEQAVKDWNQAHTESSSVQRGQSLIEEAKKYKSAEEFMKNNDLVFQGVGEGKQSQYFTTDIKEAQGYSNQKGLKGTGEIRAVKWSDIPDEVKTINADESIAPLVRKEFGDGAIGRVLTKEEFGKIQKHIYLPRDIPTTKVEGSLTDIWNKAQEVNNIPDVVPDTSKTTDMFLHNVNRMNVSESAKNAIVDEMAPFKNNIENIIGKPMTFEEVANVAQKTSDTLSNTIGKETTIDLAAKARNTKDLIATIAQDGKVTPDNLGKLYDAFAAIDTYGADLGRRLNDLKYGGNPIESSILEDLFKRMNQLGITKDKLTEAAKNFDLNTLEGQQGLFREFVKPKFENWLDTLRMNSMLSSPATHAANILSNFEGTGIIRPITKVIEGGVDTLHSLFTNTPRTRFSGEALPYLKGYYNPKTVSEAWGMAKDVLKGITDIKNVDIRDIPKADPKTVLGKIEKVLSVPMKALESMDIFFSHLSSTGEKAALDYRKSLSVTIDKMSSLVAEERATKELFRNKIINESDGILSNGVAELASKLQSLQYSKNPLIRTIAKFTMPFVRTPVNILKSGIEHNPILGIPNLINAADKTEAVSKILLGSTIMGVGLNKALAGDITFSYPTDATQKANMQAMGIPEYSIRIGNNWYSYQKLHPAVAFNLATLGAFAQAMQEGKYSDSKASDAAKALLGGSLKFLANQSYLKSWGQFMDGMNGDEFSFQQFMSNYPQQVIPFRALASWANRMILTDQKTVSKDAGFFDKQLQLIMMQIPGLSETLPNKLDSNGNPMLNPDRVRPDNLTGIMAAIGQRTSPAPDNLIEDYKNYTNARLYKKAVADSQKTDKQVLDHFVSVFNQTKDPTVKKQLLSTVLSDNPQLLGKITDALTKKKRDLNAEEKQMDDMPIKDGTRARYIVARIKSITDPTEQKKFIANLIAKKILTPNVISSITQSKQGDIAPQITQ